MWFNLNPRYIEVKVLLFIVYVKPRVHNSNLMEGQIFIWAITKGQNDKFLPIQSIYQGNELNKKMNLAVQIKSFSFHHNSWDEKTKMRGLFFKIARYFLFISDVFCTMLLLLPFWRNYLKHHETSRKESPITKTNTML